MSKNRLNIAVIPGDGIGKEVIPEGLRVLQAAMDRFDLNLHFFFDLFNWPIVPTNLITHVSYVFDGSIVEFIKGALKWNFNIFGIFGSWFIFSTVSISQ